MCPTRLPGASEWIPPHADLETLRSAASFCRGCELWRNATQVVFGAGSSTARILLVGEQPGDQEDRSGRPFVGPAGQLLDRALSMVDIDRAQVYLTNAVKHFKWQPLGQRRLHRKPTASEIRACRPWLQAEIELIRPRLLVALGATAAQALMGSALQVTKMRGRMIPSEWGAPVLVTLHPAAVLRIPDEPDRGREIERLVDDLRNATQFLREAA